MANSTVAILGIGGFVIIAAYFYLQSVGPAGISKGIDDGFKNASDGLNNTSKNISDGTNNAFKNASDGINNAFKNASDGLYNFGINLGIVKEQNKAPLKYGPSVYLAGGHLLINPGLRGFS